jgi:hypothetical protein
MMGFLALWVAVVVVVGVIAPTAALTLCALVVVAFAGPVVVAIWLRALGIEDTRREKKVRLTARRRLRRL